MVMKKGDIKKEISLSLVPGVSASCTIESVYLILSNKKKCNELLKKSELTENDIIDFYISLHLVLEVSLNSLYRKLSIPSIKKNVKKY